MTKTTGLPECPRCGWTYDYALLHPLIGSSFGQTPICPLCAKAVRKAIHGVDMPFRGMALEAYEDAVEWRKEHPEHAPKDKVL